MNADQAKQILEASINNAVPRLNDLKVDQAVTLMLDFYRNQRADDCDFEHDGDMLLFQWGTYDWGNGRFFEFDLTRQFIIGDDQEDEDIWQLSLQFEFLPNDELLSLNDGNRWCHDPTPESINAFESFIRDSAAYKSALFIEPENIRLEYFNAG